MEVEAVEDVRVICADQFVLASAAQPRLAPRCPQVLGGQIAPHSDRRRPHDGRGRYAKRVYVLWFGFRHAASFPLRGRTKPRQNRALPTFSGPSKRPKPVVA
jgi:hypothetical protein